MILELERYGILHEVYGEIAEINLTRKSGDRMDGGQSIHVPVWVLPHGATFSGARFVFDLEFRESKPTTSVVTDDRTNAFVAEADRKPSKGECWFDVSVVDASVELGEKTEGELALRFEDVPESLTDEAASCFLSATVQYDHEEVLQGMMFAPLVRRERFGPGRPPDVDGSDDDTAMLATADDVWAFHGEVVALTDDAATVTLEPVEDDAGLPSMTLTYPLKRLPYYGRFEGAHFETYVGIDPDLERLDGDETHPASNRTTFAIVDESRREDTTQFSLRWTDSEDVSGTLAVTSDDAPRSLADAAGDMHLSFSMSYDSDATPDDVTVDAVELWRREVD